MAEELTNIRVLANLNKYYPDKLISLKHNDLDDKNSEIAMLYNFERNDADAIMVYYDDEKEIKEVYELDYKNAYSDFIDNTEKNYHLVYIHPDIVEAFVEELKEYSDEDNQCDIEPYKSLLVQNNEKVLNDVDSLLNDNDEKNNIDDNSCMEDLFKSLNNLKDSFKDVVKNMDIVKGSDCLYDDEDYPFKEYGNRETLKEISDKMTKWVDSITEQNKEAGNIK